MVLGHVYPSVHPVTASQQSDDAAFAAYHEFSFFDLHANMRSAKFKFVLHGLIACAQKNLSLLLLLGQVRYSSCGATRLGMLAYPLSAYSSDQTNHMPDFYNGDP